MVIGLVVLFSGTSRAQKHHSERTYSERKKDADAFLDSALKANDPAETAEAWYRLAKLDHNKLNFLQSNQKLLRGIRILEKKGPSFELGRNYYWLAINAREMQDKEGALLNIENALSIYHACNSDRGRMLAYGFLSNAYDNTSPVYFDKDIFKVNYPLALHYARLSYHYARKLNNNKVLEDLKFLIPRLVKLSAGEAQHHLMELNLEILKKSNNISDHIIVSLDYSRHLAQQGQFDSSLVILTRIKNLIDHITDSQGKFHLYYEKAAAEHFRMTGDYKKSLAHLEKFYEYKVNNLQQDREGAISELLISYETEKKETALKLREQNLKSTQSMLWLSMVFLAVAVGLGVFLYRLSKKSQAISRRNSLLVQEQNHRVKNNLQVVSSLLNLQSNSISDAATRQLIEETQLRISAMVHLHRQLYEKDQADQIDIDRFFHDLAENILESFDMSHVLLKSETNNIHLPADTATLVGLLLNELITNACKYAFPKHPEPQLTIHLAKEPGKHHELRVKDNGLKRPDLRNNHSFGSRLIHMMVSQLEGTSEYNYDNGLEFKLLF